MRHNLQLELDHTKRIIEENEKHHVQQLAELERKFDLAKEAPADKVLKIPCSIGTLNLSHLIIKG